jgi:hypothetical protein
MAGARGRRTRQGIRRPDALDEARRGGGARIREVAEGTIGSGDHDVEIAVAVEVRERGRSLVAEIEGFEGIRGPGSEREERRLSARALGAGEETEAEGEAHAENESMSEQRTGHETAPAGPNRRRDGRCATD